MQEIVFAYSFVINLAGLALMGMDKHRAKRDAWRISEKTLFSVAVFGGALGVWLGMQIFRHKTRHWYFKYGIPAIFMAELFLLAFLCTK